MATEKIYDKNLVTIVVPCFIDGPFLSEALNSVLMQTHQSWECIIVNDGSDDNTEEIAKDWCSRDERFQYIFQENEGVSVARNKGVRAGKGEFILPLDADDRIGSEYLKLAIEAFRKDPELKLVYCEAEKFGLESGFWELPPYTYENQLLGNHIFSAAVFKQEDFKKTGGYNEKMKDGYEDWDFWLSLLKKDDRVYKIPEVLFYYRIKGSSRDRNMLAQEKHKKMQHQIFMNHAYSYFEFFGDPISIIKHNRSLGKDLQKVRASLLWRLFNRLTQIFKKNK